MNAAILVVTAVMAFDPAFRQVETMSDVVATGSSPTFRVHFARRDYVVHDRAAVAELNALFAAQRTLSDRKEAAAHAKRIEKRLNVMMPPLIARGVALPLKGY